MQNFFDMFGLPVQFDIDVEEMEIAYRKVQATTHPDRFVSAPAAERRVAMQWATRANEAFQTLKDPSRRATYLCGLAGVDIEAESNTAMPAAFLMQQMAWREQLDDVRAARSAAMLDSLSSEVDEVRSGLLEKINAAFAADSAKDAALLIRQLMFLDKMRSEFAQLRRIFLT